MSLLEDNTPADQAYVEDWKDAVSKIVEKMKGNMLTPDVVYLAMIEFLRNWAEIGSDGTISRLCEDLEKSNFKNDDWLAAVNIVMTGTDDPYLHLMH